MHLFCTYTHFCIWTCESKPLSSPVLLTILRQSSSIEIWGGGTRGRLEKMTEKHLSASNLTSRGGFQKLDIKCPNLKDSFAPVFIRHFSTYLKGFKTSVLIWWKRCLSSCSPGILCGETVSVSILILKCQVCDTTFPVLFKAFRTIIIREILNSKFLLPAYSINSPDCDRTALTPVTCNFI